MCAGLDVAGPGEDETVLCLRQGPRIILLRSWAGQDPRGDVLAALAPYRSKLKTINVDVVGIGYYMARHLRDHKLPVREINVGLAARNKEKFLNLKAEIYWGFRERALGGDLAGLTDDRTIAQLAGIRYLQNSRGQIVIESKEEARKRGVKSPDRAEAVILAFADAGPRWGLLELWKEQVAAMRQSENSPGGGQPVSVWPARGAAKGSAQPTSPPILCTKCGKPPAIYQDAWRCGNCQLTVRFNAV